jgi:hypothetical protein
LKAIPPVHALFSACVWLSSLSLVVAVGLSTPTNDIFVAVAACRNSDAGGGFVFKEPVRFDDGLLWRPLASRVSPKQVSPGERDPKNFGRIRGLASDFWPRFLAARGK